MPQTHLIMSVGYYDCGICPGVKQLLLNVQGQRYASKKWEARSSELETLITETLSSVLLLLLL